MQGSDEHVVVKGSAKDRECLITVSGGRRIGEGRKERELLEGAVAFERRMGIEWQSGRWIY